MNLYFHLQVVGALMLTLAALHVDFPRRFHWREELSRLSLLNRQIFIVHCLFILLVLILTGVLSLVFADALLAPSPLAVPVLGGLAIFWSLRLLVQWFVYDRRLWRGRPFQTAVHLTFSCLWCYFATVYAWALTTQF